MKNKEKELKYKIGDEIVCTFVKSEAKIWLTKGEVYIIKEYNDMGNPLVEGNNGVLTSMGWGKFNKIGEKMFRENDKVECMSSKYAYIHEGQEAIVVRVKGCSMDLDCEPISERGLHYSISDFIKANRYEKLKKKIDDLDEGSSLKRWDDVLFEIAKASSSDGPWPTSIEIADCYQEGNGLIASKGEIIITGNSCNAYFVNANDRVKPVFPYNNKCEKLNQLKAAYYWFLNNSDIEKDITGTTQKIKIKGKIYEAEIIREV